MSKSKSITKNILYLFLTILMAVALTGCNEDNTETKGGGAMEDPYVAYGLEKGDFFDLLEAMREKPPKALLLQSAFYYRAYYETVPQNGEILLEKGKNVNIALDVDTVHESSGVEVNIKSDITIKYDGKKGDDDLFHADTNTYGNPTLVFNGLYVTEFGYHDVKDKPIRIKHIGEEDSLSKLGGEGLYFYVVLHPDKGDADKGDGNIGFLYLRVAGVKR